MQTLLNCFKGLKKALSFPKMFPCLKIVSFLKAPFGFVVVKKIGARVSSVTCVRSGNPV